MDPKAVLDAIASHQYILLLALVVGFLVRLLKSDTKIPIDIPPRYRIWLAFGFGMLGGVLEKVSAGTTWKVALIDGACAAAVAVLGQNVLIDSIRGGKEFNLPGLIVPNTAPSPGNPVTVPPPSDDDDAGKGPPPMPPLMVVALLASFFLAGCTKILKVAELAAQKAACVVAHQELSNPEIFLTCAIEPGDMEKYADLLAQSRASTKKALERQAASNPSTRVDAGVSTLDGGCK